jgi:hypothetical protein
MKLSITGPKSSLEFMPTEVLSRIALYTVFISSGVPTPHELTAVRSLPLTSRTIYQKLALLHNPHLYANIFHTMFDVDAVKRRMGPRAVVSSSLASELKQRVEALKKINADLDAVEHEADISNATSVDLTRVFLMMTEDNGKNRRQLADFVNLSRVPDLLFSHASRIGPFPEELAKNPSLGLIVAIMWMSSDGESSSLLSIFLRSK